MTCEDSSLDFVPFASENKQLLRDHLSSKAILVQGRDRNPNYPPSEVDFILSPPSHLPRETLAGLLEQPPVLEGWTEPGLRVSNLILHRRTPARLLVFLQLAFSDSLSMCSFVEEE